MAGVAGDLCDETEVDEAQAHCTNEAVVSGVVEVVPGGDVIGDRPRSLVFGHSFGQSFAIADACQVASSRVVYEPGLGVSFHLCKSGVVHHRTAIGADRRSVL